jgi:hypothetical protein
MQVYYFYSEEEDVNDFNSEDWSMFNLCIPLKTNKDGSVEPDTKDLLVGHNGSVVGWDTIRWDEEVRIWPHKLHDDLMRKFIKAAFSGNAHDYK